MEISGTVTVDRPPSEVFPLFGDLERAGEYLKGFERRKLTEGSVGVGTRYLAKDRWPGRTVEFTVEYAAYEPDRYMAARWSEPMRGGWTATFEPHGATATDITFWSEIRPAGLMGVVAPLMRPWAARQTTGFLENFKLWAERQ